MHCVICFGSSTQEQWSALYCGHIFHHSCIQEAFNLSGQKCPICRLKKKGPKGEYFLKLFIDDDPHGGSEPQVPEDVQEDDPIRLRKKIELLNAKIEDMGRAIAAARDQSRLDQTEINRLNNELTTYEAAFQEYQSRLQQALNENNSIAAHNRRLQNEYASAKLNLERERGANSRSRLAYDTQIPSRELSAQLAMLADAGTAPPDYFQKLLESRNKALAEANTRAQKAVAARATAEASAKEETKKLKLQIQNMKAQLEEYQIQVQTLKQQLQQQQQHQQQQRGNVTTSTTSRKRLAPSLWLAETQEAARAGVRSIVRPTPQQQQQQQSNPNFLPNNNININSIDGVLATKPRGTAAAAAAAFDFAESMDGLLGPSSELPSMHPPAPIIPPPRGLQRVNGPNSSQAPVPTRVVEAAARVQPPPPPRQSMGGDVNSKDAAGAGADLAEGGRPRSSILEFQRRLKAQAAAAAQGSIPAPPASHAAPLEEEKSLPGGPIEWGTEVENAAADLDEEEDVIELISDTEEEEEEDLQIDNDDINAAAAGAAPAIGNIENDPLALNNNNSNQQQQRPPSKAAISFLAAGPSKIALASAPGTSFIRNPKFATTGLKDDATFIHSGPDGKGGRVTYFEGQHGGTRPAAVARPAWGATMKNHVGARIGAGATRPNPTNSGQGGKRGGKSGAGSSKPINQYFGGTSN